MGSVETAYEVELNATQARNGYRWPAPVPGQVFSVLAKSATAGNFWYAVKVAEASCDARPVDAPPVSRQELGGN